MAKRPIFVSIGQKPFVKTVEAEFLWHGGFAVSQQQKNILALHTAFKAVCPEKKVLEISSRSMQPLGVALSAFNLKKMGAAAIFCGLARKGLLDAAKDLDEFIKIY